MLESGEAVESAAGNVFHAIEDRIHNGRISVFTFQDVGYHSFRVAGPLGIYEEQSELLSDGNELRVAAFAEFDNRAIGADGIINT